MFVPGSFPRRIGRRPDLVGRQRKTARRGLLVGFALIAGLGPAASSAAAGPTTMVDLGAASSYAALSGASIGNTVNAPTAPHTTLRGDLGVKASAEPTGFPPGVVTGAFNVGNAAAAAAHTDAAAAYTEILGRTGAEPIAAALAGTTLSPGLYSTVGAASNTTTVTLDGGGDPNAVFVFKINGALTTAAGSHVVLTNGARASRVFWQVAGAAGIGATAGIAGTVLARDAVGVGNGTVVNGRVFALGAALTLDANEVYSGPPAVTIDGGASATTTDTTPTISGTTDVEAPAVVTVEVHGQTLTAVPSDGAWSVTSAILANATYPVVASVTDGAGNPGSATQQLTVDTVPPVVTLDGPVSVTTNDPRFRIAGTSDVDPGTVVRVSVDAQALTALVQADGTWNVAPATLSDGTRTVTASVTDPAGNDGIDSLTLTIDTVAPAATISGGATALTNDATPEVAGTAQVDPGTTVAVTVAGEPLNALVDDDHAWAVTAPALSDGSHRVTARVLDAAGNATSLTQTLTVDTVAPVVTIAGGATASTSNVQPTVRGTSNAAPDTTVTVSIAGQTMTTLLQSDGTWNVSPAPVDYGTWTVSAAAPDPAGNIGRAGQTLTIAADPVPGPQDPVDPGPAPPVDPGPPGVVPPPTSPPAPPVAPIPPAAPPVLPGTGTGPGTGTTNAAAEVTTARSGRQRVKGSRLSIGTKVRASRLGRVVVTMSGTVKIKGVKRAIKLRTVTAKIAAGKSRTVKLRPRGSSKAQRSAFRKIRSAVRGRKRVAATITIKLVDAAGNIRTTKRTVRLVR
ncbi:MAG: DUF3494 domain-containing protein [Patulibacter sp.]|nr:DUF3494 domain-containing protein [Patulibacter sp.]